MSVNSSIITVRWHTRLLSSCQDREVRWSHSCCRQLRFRHSLLPLKKSGWNEDNFSFSRLRQFTTVLVSSVKLEGLESCMGAELMKFENKTVDFLLLWCLLSGRTSFNSESQSNYRKNERREPTTWLMQNAFYEEKKQNQNSWEQVVKQKRNNIAKVTCM